MKRIVILTLVLAVVFAFAACGGKTDSAPGKDMSVEDILKEIMSDVEMAAETDTRMLDSENFRYYAFIDYVDGYEAACNEPLVSATPHSVVLVRVPEGESAQDAAKEMEENADPRKWICAEAEKTEVVYSGDLVLLVMSTVGTADAVVSSFNAFCAGA